MQTHELKSWPEFFKPVVDGQKTFEIRKNDRNFEIGDVLVLREFRPCKDCGGGGRVWSSGDTDPCGCKPPHGKYTGRRFSVEIVYITDFKQSEGQVVMAVIPYENHSAD